MSEFLSASLFFGVAVSILGYQIGLLCKRRFKIALFNPILIAVLFVILVLKGTGLEYGDYQGGAQYLNYLLTPATVCLAIPLYQKLDLLKRNWKAIFGGITAGVLASLGSVFLLSLLMGLSHQQYVTMLPKSITTAIGMGISEELGGIPTITVAAIILTGIFGNMTAEWVCKLFRVRHPIAKGLAIGTGSHAIGTTKAIELGQVEGAMSSLAIVVAGLLTVVGAFVFANFL